MGPSNRVLTCLIWSSRWKCIECRVENDPENKQCKECKECKGGKDGRIPQKFQCVRGAEKHDNNIDGRRSDCRGAVEQIGNDT